MKKEIPVASFRKLAGKPTSLDIRLESRLDPTNRGESDTPLAEDRPNEAVNRCNLVKDKRQYLNIQYRITRELLKAETPSNAIIKQARKLGHVVKSSDEEMKELELIADQDISVAVFDKRAKNTIAFKFGPERRSGPVDRRKHDYHKSKDRRNEDTDRRSLLNYSRQYLSLQYRITQLLLKAVTPSNKIIEHAFNIGRIIKISEEELSELKLILKPSR